MFHSLYAFSALLEPSFYKIFSIHFVNKAYLNIKNAKKYHLNSPILYFTNNILHN